jgi:hypothetical protein
MPLFKELVAPLGVPLRDDGRVHFVGGFYAQWEWQVTNLEYIGVPFLQQIQHEEVGSGWTQVSCHPGYRSPDFASVYLAEREQEVRTLTDPRIFETRQTRAALEHPGCGVGLRAPSTFFGSDRAVGREPPQRRG